MKVGVRRREDEGGGREETRKMRATGRVNEGEEEQGVCEKESEDGGIKVERGWK